MTTLEIDLAMRLNDLQDKYDRALAVIEILAKCNSPSAIMFLRRYKTNHPMTDNTTAIKKITA